jgi:hypothetical protein
MPRRSRKNRPVAEFVASLLEPAGFVKEWWTDRDAMNAAGAKRADDTDSPCYLYIDDGRDEDYIVITVQKIKRT